MDEPIFPEGLVRPGYGRGWKDRRKIKAVDAAWAAAAVDGEGSILLATNQTRGRIQKRRHGVVILYNTDFRFVFRFHKITGGPVYRLKPSGVKAGRGRPMYACRLNARSTVVWFLRAIIQFLVIKRSNARRILRYYETHPIVRNPRWHGATDGS